MPYVVRVADFGTTRQNKFSLTPREKSGKCLRKESLSVVELIQWGLTDVTHLQTWLNLERRLFRVISLLTL